MLTLEQFYFNPDEIEVSASCNKGQRSLLFVPGENESLHIQISTLDRKTFVALLARIQEMGQAILDAKPSQTVDAVTKDDLQRSAPFFTRTKPGTVPVAGGVNYNPPDAGAVVLPQENTHEDQAIIDRGSTDTSADANSVAVGIDGHARGGSDSRDGEAVLYTAADIDAGIGAIYNTTRLTNIQARALAQHVRTLLEGSRCERLAAAVPPPAPERMIQCASCRKWIPSAEPPAPRQEQDGCTSKDGQHLWETLTECQLCGAVISRSPADPEPEPHPHEYEAKSVSHRDVSTGAAVRHRADVRGSGVGDAVPDRRPVDEVALAAAPHASLWQDVGSHPKGRKVLIAWLGALGRWRTTCAAYFDAGTLDMDDDQDGSIDEEGRNAEAGWFEESEVRDPGYWHLDVTPLLWQPLPLAPARDPHERTQWKKRTTRRWRRAGSAFPEVGYGDLPHLLTGVSSERDTL